MKVRKFITVVVVLNIGFNFANAQQQDTIKTFQNCNSHQFKLKKLILPSILIGYGIVGIESDQLKFFNTNIKEEVNENIDKKTILS